MTGISHEEASKWAKKKYLLVLCLDYFSVFLEHGWYEKVYIKTTKKYLINK